MSGDEWKGEDDYSMSPLYSFFGVKPLSAEQLAKAKEKTKAALAMGDLLYASLPVFDAERPCAKCGSPKRHTRYRTEPHSDEERQHTGENDFLKIVCRRCGAASYERPLDAQPREEDA